MSRQADPRRPLTRGAARTMSAAKIQSRPPEANTVAEPGERDLLRLAGLIGAYTPHEGRFDVRLPGVHVVRVSRTHKVPGHALQQPGLCIVAQGAKNVMLGQEVYEYDAFRMLTYSVDVSVAFQITRASPSEPFLSFTLDLDPHKIAELALKVYPHGLPTVQESRAVAVCPSDAGIVRASIRLFESMAEPGDAELLAPLVVDEMLIRLLRSPIGGQVAQLGHAKSGLHRVAQAITLTETMDAGTASRQVGYRSASQFSREYSRLFGSAPTKDIATLREQGAPTADFPQ